MVAQLFDPRHSSDPRQEGLKFRSKFKDGLSNSVGPCYKTRVKCTCLQFQAFGRQRQEGQEFRASSNHILYGG